MLPERFYIVSLWVFFMFGSLVLTGQNLVPNPDFNDFTRCPDNRGQIILAAPWYSPNGRTTDFAHMCAGNGFTGIPFNNWGVEEPYAGNGYAGIRTWGVFNWPGPYREYLAVKLLDSLEAGEIYRVNFRISLGDSARYTTDDIALHLSRDSFPRQEVIRLSPHVSNPEGRVIQGTFGWQLVSGQYKAQGGEQHLIIGNFNDDPQTTVVDRNLAAGLGGNSTYFYIDHVVVEPCTEEFPAHLIVSGDSTLCPGDSLVLLAEEVPRANYTWDNGSEEPIRVVGQPGLVTLKTEIDGCYRIDSLEITYAPIPQLDLGADTTLCPGETLLVGAKDPIDKFRWNDRHSELMRNIDRDGTYILELALGSCIFVDSVKVEYEEAYVQIPPRDTLVCDTEPVTLLASVKQAKYLWSDMSRNLSYQALEAGQYWVDIETRCFTAREHFSIQTEDCGCESFIPNVFSPNGDGIQDRFRLDFTEGISNYSLEVFDRYGRSLFISQHPDESWDGSKNGKMASEGVYFWVVQYRCYRQGKFAHEVKKGHVSLLR